MAALAALIIGVAELARAVLDAPDPEEVPLGVEVVELVVELDVVDEIPPEPRLANPTAGGLLNRKAEYTLTRKALGEKEKFAEVLDLVFEKVKSRRKRGLRTLQRSIRRWILRPWQRPLLHRSFQSCQELNEKRRREYGRKGERNIGSQETEVGLLIPEGKGYSPPALNWSGLTA